MSEERRSKAQLDLLREMMRLKAVPRIGWLLRGVRDVESVASHTFGVAIISMLLADIARERGMEVDVERVLRMALLHDLTEARIGDLPSTVKHYFDPHALKVADERAASEMLSQVGEIGESLLNVWQDYEHRANLEARIVKAADKFDLLMQAYEYERGGAKSLDEFWNGAANDFAGLGIGDLVEDLFEELIDRREQGEEVR
jgi:putative hydrolase of HD superfamily